MPMDSRNIWSTIYQEVNEHLRATDKKRDQIIAFYLVLLAALIGAWKGLNGFRNVAVIAAWVVGLGSFWVTTQCWRWHIVFSCSMVTLQRLMFFAKEPSLDECEDAWNVVNNTDTKVCELLNPGRGVETAVMYLHAIMTFVPLYLLLKNLWVIPQTMSVIILVFIASILGAIVYACLLVFFSSRFVSRYYKFEFAKNDWMFRWLGCSTRS